MGIVHEAIYKSHTKISQALRHRAETAQSRCLKTALHAVGIRQKRCSRICLSNTPEQRPKWPPLHSPGRCWASLQRAICVKYLGNLSEDFPWSWRCELHRCESLDESALRRSFYVAVGRSCISIRDPPIFAPRSRQKKFLRNRITFATEQELAKVPRVRVVKDPGP